MDNDQIRIMVNCIKDLSRNDSFLSMQHYIQHGHTDCLMHSIAVAYFSYATAKCLHLKLNEKSLVRGALLHDFFLYDWHIPDCSHSFHGFTHPNVALKNAQDNWLLNEIEIDIIKKHMFPLIPGLPRFKESILVCVIDKICSISEMLPLPSSKEVNLLYGFATTHSKYLSQ